jgi:hypothetical protein
LQITYRKQEKYSKDRILKTNVRNPTSAHRADCSAVHFDTHCAFGGGGKVIYLGTKSELQFCRE